MHEMTQPVGYHNPEAATIAIEGDRHNSLPWPHGWRVAGHGRVDPFLLLSRISSYEDGLSSMGQIARVLQKRFSCLFYFYFAIIYITASRTARARGTHSARWEVNTKIKPNTTSRHVCCL